MKKQIQRKGGKPMIYKDNIGDCVVLVTSRDPNTKIQILKEKKHIINKKKQNKVRGILSYW